MSHFLALEGLIADRLRERLDGSVHVLTAPALDAIASGTQPTPAVYVLYAGGSVSESRQDGLAARIAQQWMVLVAVRNVAQIASGAPARADAGTIADAVLAALMGWQPPGTSQPLRLSALPDPGFIAGLQWVPLTFSTEFTRRVAPGA